MGYRESEAVKCEESPHKLVKHRGGSEALSFVGARAGGAENHFREPAYGAKWRFMCRLHEKGLLSPLTDGELRSWRGDGTP